jgi:hypothetical protein
VKHGWGKPKTHAGRRIVPLSAAADLALGEMATRWDGRDLDAPVFAAATGNPMDAHNIAARVLAPAGEKVGCPWLHWHALRHTAASLSELDLTARRKVLGHTTEAMSMGYSHPVLATVRAGLDNIVPSVGVAGPGFEDVIGALEDAAETLRLSVGEHRLETAPEFERLRMVLDAAKTKPRWLHEIKNALQNRR